MTFTEKQQTAHRKEFIEECRQKAWGAGCHAAWIAKGLDNILAHYQKLQSEDKTLEGQLKEAEGALDYHTVENRDRRKGINERRHKLGEEMNLVSENASKGHQAMQQLLQSAENSLALAAHAEKWEWKEVESTPHEEVQTETKSE